ncbi:hypothetical protein O59_001977 [Cellvibrio sp. BR]|uniref:hypothetical protein n=1 Tax=Cellvibrio sp. BR TaxID=1134474 RepID=UPI00026013BD|nr:hypothetical protein [Cellvibrio sp. BR]EIK45299.1 hypothetical protein O59_001977 [Cellvibrio sp. BR]
MHIPERNQQAPEATQPQERVSPSSDQPAANWEADVAQTVQLGEQLIGFAGGVIDLARTEALLAVHTLPKVMMLWLIMMPIILLTWCSFSALVAWSVVALSEQLGLGMLTFFLLQVLLLFVCRWLFVKYRARMTFPYTRAHIDNFVRSTKNEFSRRSETKE